MAGGLPLAEGLEAEVAGGEAQADARRVGGSPGAGPHGTCRSHQGCVSLFLGQWGATEGFYTREGWDQL